ncbi:unnamed protein product [Citrullus colocynthis]|uniref:Uncharacterized protein n=1 Tax=Citrullus colocynthis TaxID=252529 RepID=A0ABP0YZ36_9ROSI
MNSVFNDWLLSFKESGVDQLDEYFLARFLVEDRDKRIIVMMKLWLSLATSTLQTESADLFGKWCVGSQASRMEVLGLKHATTNLAIASLRVMIRSLIGVAVRDEYLFDQHWWSSASTLHHRWSSRCSLVSASVFVNHKVFKTP